MKRNKTFVIIGLILACVVTLVILSACSKQETIITFKPKEEISQNDLNLASVIIDHRIKYSGYKDFAIEVKDGKIITNFGEVAVGENLGNAVGVEGRVTYEDSAGNVILENVHLNGAELKTGVIPGGSVEENYVELSLTEAGQVLLFNATTQMLQREDRYIAVCVDGDIVSVYKVADVAMSGKQIVQSESFSNINVAEWFVEIVNGGKLPCPMEVTYQ